jgi:peptidoglycan/LPS O-acetylase OafA/YrhL
MLAHTVNAFKYMPWHVTRVTDLGWNGVQLFFVVSALTLTMSWKKRSSKEARPYLAFMIRRFFRIAPMFYIALIFYLVFFFPGNKFSFFTLVTTMIFMHGWTPTTMSTLVGGWSAVPGGWSIAVESSFYLIFPFLIKVITNTKTAATFIIFSLIFSFSVDKLGYELFVRYFGQRATSQYIFYWIPNQITVFGIGFFLYFVLEKYKYRISSGLSCFLCSILVLCFFAIGYLHFPRVLVLHFPYLPIHIAESLIFFMFIVVLSKTPSGLFINRPFSMLGKVSFSAYLIHFAVINFLGRIFNLDSSNVVAIELGISMFTLVIFLTFAFSYMTYRLIEQPMIAIGRKVADRMGGRRHAVENARLSLGR